MKKFFLIVFIASSLFAGKSFENRIHEIKLKLLQIRTKLGYDLPPEEQEWHEELTLQEKITLFNEFKTLWNEFQADKKQLDDFFGATREKCKFYFSFVQEFINDKKIYESAVSREWLWLPEENGIDPHANNIRNPIAINENMEDR